MKQDNSTYFILQDFKIYFKIHK